MPQWNDNNANLSDREDALRSDLGGSNSLPVGGSTGQVLKKNSGTNGDASWGSVAEAALSLSDVTTANVSTTKHGLAPKSPNDATKYLDGTGAYSVPAGSGGGGTGLGLLTWNVAGTLTTQTGTLQLPVPATATIADVTIRAATQPTGASIKVDVNKNGTTIFTTQANRPTIAVSTNASSAAVPDVTGLVATDYLTVDIDQAGSTIAGADLVIVLRFA